MVGVLLAGGGPEGEPAIPVETLQGQAPHVRAVHVVMKGNLLDLAGEFPGLEIRGPGRVVPRRLEIEIIIPLVGPRGPRVTGMGAPGLAGPVELGGALDDGPAPDVDFEAGGMFEGVGGGRPKGQEKNQGGFECVAKSRGVFHFGISLV